MVIKDLKYATIGSNIIIRIISDKDGIDGYGEIENTKVGFIGSIIPMYRDIIIGCDPTDIGDVMRRIVRLGAFKPWGAVVSAIEMALYDLTGKEYGIPAYKLMGGKVREKVRVYQGSYKTQNTIEAAKRGENVFGRQYEKSDTPEEVAESILALNEGPAGFTAVKCVVGFHGFRFFEKNGIDDYMYSTPVGFNQGVANLNSPLPSAHRSNQGRANTGSLLTERGLNALIEYVFRIKEVVKDKVGIALDCGPGMVATDALRFARAVEPCNLLWLEDMICGDYTPYTMAHVYRDITMQTTTPIHTGEQIYLRENFRELIEGQCVNVVGPDPEDVGGIGELKWIAEYANLHGIMMAPHGTFDGAFGLAALTHCCSTMPNNYIAFEFPGPEPYWWPDIVEGLPDPIVEKGHVRVWDKPGLGVEFNIKKAEKYLRPEDKEFFL